MHTGHYHPNVLRICTQNAHRPPIYTVRVNPLRGCSVQSLLTRLEKQEGIQARASSLLPDDFIEITSGLQALLVQVRKN